MWIISALLIVVGVISVVFAMMRSGRVILTVTAVLGAAAILLGVALAVVPTPGPSGLGIPMIIAAIGSLVVLIFATLALIYWRSAHGTVPANEIKANLAISLGMGAAVTVSVVVLQFAVQGIAERQGYQAAREAVKVAVAVEPDLSGFSAPRDPELQTEPLNMDGYWLRGKKMPMASMQEVSLRGSNLVFTDLSGAFLRGADLSEGENGTRTDLRSASLYWADLTDVVAGGASFFGVDLRRAILCGVDLREADLRYADLREAAVNETPTPQGETCGSNPAFLPPPEGSDGTCWPTDTPEDPLCGDEARQMLCQRGSVVAQLPAVRPCEG